MIEPEPKNRLSVAQLLHAMNMIVFSKSINFKIDEASSKQVEKQGFETAI